MYMQAMYMYMSTIELCFHNVHADTSIYLAEVGDVSGNVLN